jgi:hypothetical protein
MLIDALSKRRAHRPSILAPRQLDGAQVPFLCRLLFPREWSSRSTKALHEPDSARLAQIPSRSTSFSSPRPGQVIVNTSGDFRARRVALQIQLPEQQASPVAFTQGALRLVLPQEGDTRVVPGNLRLDEKRYPFAILSGRVRF